MVIPFIEAVTVAFDGVADVSYLVSLPCMEMLLFAWTVAFLFASMVAFYVGVLIVHGDCDVFVRGS